MILDAGEKILDAIADYVSVEYNLPKMDQVAIPDFNPGAMENWGLVTYREERFFWNESVNTHTYKTALITVIAHEFGHQWFGNLVGPSWWTYIWLNEGFANLFEHIGVDLVSCFLQIIYKKGLFLFFKKFVKFCKKLCLHKMQFFL